MPIKIPDKLPATAQLRKENIFVMSEKKAMHQDIRPLKIVIVNLMPTKIATETQLLRLLSNTPLQVDITLVKTETHNPKNTSQEHLVNFYTTFNQIKEQYFDALIITGAPVELLDFNSVHYWKELCDIMEWSKTHAFSTVHICWAAFAGLYYHYGIPKRQLPHKLFGVFEHTVEDPNFILFRGFDDRFWVPHSRNTTVDRADIEAVPGLKVLAASPEAGVYAVKTEGGRQVYLMGHAEYDRDTLRLEYERDVKRGLPIAVPENYFEDDDPAKGVVFRWRSHANLFFSNWLNYYVYQETPYDLEKL